MKTASSDGCLLTPNHKHFSGLVRFLVCVSKNIFKQVMLNVTKCISYIKKIIIKLGQIYNVPCNAKTDARHVREVNTINSIFLNCIGQNVSQKNMQTRFILSDFCHSTALCCSSRKLHSDCSLAAPCPS